MPITANDIKLMQPERLTDDEDGGGQMTGLEVIDGDINNLFEDISRVNRTYGNVSMKKAFLKVDTPTADLYLDAHSILSAQPADPNVSGLLFTTNDFYDERASARQRVESFVVPGPVTGLHLRGNQLEGQRSIIVYANKINSVPPPEIGQTLMLKESEILSSQQFVKILAVTQTEETFTYTLGNDQIPRTFDADQYVLQISSDLKRDFPADDPSPLPSSPTRVYSTQPATSAKYYGTTTLATAALAAATSIQVAETFAPIIPTASSETVVIDQRPGGYLAQVVPAGPSKIAITMNLSSETVSTLPTAIVPGSMELNYSGEIFTDSGGILVNGSGNPSLMDGVVIDYKTGSIQWPGGLSGARTLNYRPGTLRQQLPNTGKIEIDDTNRNFNYVLSLDPPPARGTFNASYQYLGKWYAIQDNGTGTLIGDGSGQVNYDTGSIALTLQAQPDSGSVIFYRWTEGGLYGEGTADAFASSTPVELSLAGDSVKPGTITITWTSNSITRTATDTDGSLSGDGTGTVDYETGRLLINTTLKPDPGTSWTVDYTHKNTANQTNSQAVAANSIRSDFTLQTAAGIQPGSVAFTLEKAVARTVNSYSTIVETDKTQIHLITDNGGGAIIDRRNGVNVGTVDYTTGEITVAGDSLLKSYVDPA